MLWDFGGEATIQRGLAMQDLNCQNCMMGKLTGAPCFWGEKNMVSSRSIEKLSNMEEMYHSSTRQYLVYILSLMGANRNVVGTSKCSVPDMFPHFYRPPHHTSGAFQSAQTRYALDLMIAPESAKAFCAVRLPARTQLWTNASSHGFVQMLGIPTIPLWIPENDGKHAEVGVSYFQTNPHVISSILAV